ncbi:GntR family transcriptional regulator [Serratia odorifera]|uniref:GntR family transcriptional regulator n=1 Tax=Serratia odorifera TaxID=618 RepID=UPI000310EDC3|nr:GntR family transcriptional regulator [Serratia odorifera]MBJ2065642.1 GntR family transcriptional regulator [Serratia odorifera]PNK92605.1 GntR family transcriptional regulator [Serratia odorifera]RII73703.1 GntR family transcriptional regulator [Serratia odorifera]HEJ9095682.1 GntR family transcriptional regulator [Serratia odorifera]
MVVDKASYTPLYKQLYSIICHRILDGTYRLGDRLPTQKDIARQFDVSLIVVKQAWNALVESGIIASQRGTGSVVNALPEGASYGHTFRGITADLSFSQIRIDSQILDIALRSAKDALLDGLNLPPGNKYLFISRVRSAKGKPFNHEKIYINLAFFPGLQLQPQDLANQSLYQLLMARYQIAIGSAVEKIDAILPSRELCELLQIAANTPLLSVARQTFLSGADQPFEYCRYAVLSEYFGEIHYQ